MFHFKTILMQINITIQTMCFIFKKTVELMSIYTIVLIKYKFIYLIKSTGWWYHNFLGWRVYT